MIPLIPATLPFGASLDPVSLSGPAASAVSTAGDFSSTMGLAVGAAPASSAPAPFADLVTEAVGSIEGLGRQAKVAVEGLMSGSGVDVHEAMIATQKAGMGFELVLAVRNKALASYQQVMGMQF